MTDPFDGVAPSIRHGIEQTVAAERLEGWQPSEKQIADLVSLARGELLFGEYLASYVVPELISARRHTRRILRRNRPYLIPGTTVLRNSFGTDSHEVLARLEFVATAGRMTQWHCRIAGGHVTNDDVDFAKVHQHVFADVYAWAGSYRVTELRRGESLFAWQSEIGSAMDSIRSGVRRLLHVGADLEAAGLAYEFARVYAEYNRIHPFREGNGRAGTLVLHTLAALCGRRLDLSGISRGEWIDASRDSLPARRSGDSNHRPLLPLFIRAVR
jgi:cell filamentation protein